jgi:hypothetical protein
MCPRLNSIRAPRARAVAWPKTDPLATDWSSKPLVISRASSWRSDQVKHQAIS